MRENEPTGATTVTSPIRKAMSGRLPTIPDSRSARTAAPRFLSDAPGLLRPSLAHANGRRRGLVPIEQGTPFTISIDQEVVFGSYVCIGQLGHGSARTGGRNSGPRTK